MTELATVLALALATLSTGPPGDDERVDVRLLATSAPSARAVVALEGRDLEVVEPGDALGDSGMTVVRVLPGRLAWTIQCATKALSTSG